MRIFNGRRTRLLFMGGLLSLSGLLLAVDAYRTPQEVNAWCKDFAQKNQANVKLQTLAESPGGQPVYLLEIGKAEDKPAVLVVANMNGLRPLTSEGAIQLCEMLVENEAALAGHSYYVLPQGNPDAANGYFSGLLQNNPGNATPTNDDLDEATDEDGFDDLNGDGYITLMRVKHPEGSKVVVGSEPRLMRDADKESGETGVYKIYKEGLDNDGDGKYNEDGPGGTNVNLNFPHLFKAFDPGTGLYPGSAPEAFGLIEYVYAHPEIAMAVAFGETNFCIQPPKGGRKGGADLSSIKIPDNYVEMLNAEKGKTYTIEEIIEMVQPMVPAGMEVTESMIASFLGLGAAVNPLAPDLTFYEKLSKDYKSYLEDKGVKGKRLDPAKAKDGSFELWAYYHLGIPVFSMDLFWIDKPEEKKEEGGSGITLESLEQMSTEEFIALGEEKIDLFLEESGAPEQFSAKRVISMMESGQADPKRMAGMMKQMPKPKKDDKGPDEKEAALLAYSDEVLDGKGFVNWEKFDHPTLGEVEIGGFVPHMTSTPPEEVVDSLLDLQLPWVLELSSQLPDLEIVEAKTTDMGAGVYKLELWTGNKGYLPFPTAMGKRNSYPAPAIIEISGDKLEFLEGYARTPVNAVAGSSRVKHSWLIQSAGKGELTIRLQSKAAGTDVESVKLGD